MSLTIRKAENKDTAKVLDLLHQVLEVHAGLRPDLFISGTTKYTDEELHAIFADETTPVLHPHRTLYIDDICVDSAARGQHVATRLYEYVKAEAERLGCYNITLNVWAGNDGAQKFYEAMGMKPRKTMMETILGD